MEVSSLDSPGASSGYCSGTDEDLASVCDSGLASGYPDSLYYCSASSPFDPDRLDSLIGPSFSYDTPPSTPGIATYEPELNGSPEFPDLGITDRNFRDLWRSWFSDDDNGSGIMTDFSQMDFIEPYTRLFSEFQEKDEEPSRLLQFLDASGTKGDVTDIIADLPTMETNGEKDKLGDNSAEEEDWCRIFSEEEWDRMGSTGMMSLQDECLYPLDEFREDAVHTVTNNVEASDDSTRNTPDNLNKDGSRPTNTSIRRKISGTKATVVQVQLEKTSGGPEEERSRSFPSKTRTDSGEPQVPMKIKGSGRGVAKVVPDPAVRFDGLEDHRYSSRRCEVPGGGTATPCSVLEALLRTSGRLNPNKGSAVIFCGEIKKRNAESTTMQPSSNSNRLPRGATRTAQKHRNTLLHNLLTCRIDEVEKNRRNIRGGKELLERRTQVENTRKIVDLSRSDKGDSFDEITDSYSEFSSSMAWSDSDESQGDTGVKVGSQFRLARKYKNCQINE